VILVVALVGPNRGDLKPWMIGHDGFPMDIAGYSVTFAPEFAITFAQYGISVLTADANSAGEILPLWV
jgi:hypothetical protein